MAKPALPALREVAGTVGLTITEIRNFLSRLLSNPMLWGKTVSTTFTASDVSGNVIKRVTTGLGYPVTGFFVVRGADYFRLWEQPVPTTESDNSALYLQASAAGTYTFWVY